MRDLQKKLEEEGAHRASLQDEAEASRTVTSNLQRAFDAKLLELEELRRATATLRGERDDALQQAQKTREECEKAPDLTSTETTLYSGWNKMRMTCTMCNMPTIYIEIVTLCIEIVTLCFGNVSWIPIAPPSLPVYAEFPEFLMTDRL